MRVLMVPMDLEACGFFRVLEPCRVAQSIGVDVNWTRNMQVIGRPPVDEPSGPALPEQRVSTERMRFSQAPPRHSTEPPSGDVWALLMDAQVLVLQRPLYQGTHAVAVAAKRQGMRVVVELDDDLNAVHKRNLAKASVDPAAEPWHNTNWAAETIQLADLIVVSTPALARLYGERAVVVRNRLPERILQLRPAVSPARGAVGWTGWVGTHPEDLQATAGGLSRVDAPVRVVGDTRYVAQALSLPPARVSLGAAWNPVIPEYWGSVVANIGVGIAPLQQSAFNRSKSGLKCQEYMALGIPYVASPLPEYQWLTKESGAGFIAESRGQWTRRVNNLLNDDTAYEQARSRGLEWSEEHTLERHIDEHVAVWERAYNMGKNPVTV